MIAIPPEPWVQQAACRGYPEPDLWFAHMTEIWDRREALDVCRRCPVRAECLDYAVSDPEINAGIWGGMGFEQIKQLRRRRGTA